MTYIRIAARKIFHHRGLASLEKVPDFGAAALAPVSSEYSSAVERHGGPTFLAGRTAKRHPPVGRVSKILMPDPHHWLSKTQTIACKKRGLLRNQQNRSRRNSFL